MAFCFGCFGPKGAAHGQCLAPMHCVVGIGFDGAEMRVGDVIVNWLAAGGGHGGIFIR